VPALQCWCCLFKVPAPTSHLNGCKQTLPEFPAYIIDWSSTGQCPKSLPPSLCSNSAPLPQATFRVVLPSNVLSAKNMSNSASSSSCLMQMPSRILRCRRRRLHVNPWHAPLQAHIANHHLSLQAAAYMLKKPLHLQLYSFYMCNLRGTAVNLAAHR
jgi:hypothetical protein